METNPMDERSHTGKKFLAIVVLLGAVFAAGFYMGRQPPEEIERQFQELSQEVVEQTVGLVEGDLLVQKKVLQAMSGFLNGRANILDGKHKEAVADLEETLEYLEEAVKMKGEETSDALRETMVKIQELRDSLANDQATSQEALEEIQDKLNALLL